MNRNDVVQLSGLAKWYACLREPDAAAIILNDFARRRAGALANVINRGLLAPRVMADAKTSAANLLRVSRWDKLNDADRFLAASPHIWARFSEPQITGGWKHFLDGPHCLARCKAAFKVAFNAAMIADSAQPDIEIIESVDAELGRIDLLIIAEAGSGEKVALCIEAKFGHFLTPGQLASYQAKIANDHKIKDRKNRFLCLIAPLFSGEMHRQIMTAENEWLFLSWQQWLIAYENALSPEHDDEEFCRFRHTTLERAYLELRN